jgi:hypothetical protein
VPSVIWTKLDNGDTTARIDLSDIAVKWGMLDPEFVRANLLLRKVEYTANAPDQTRLQPSPEADCSVLRKRIAELEEGLRQIAVWKQEDQDNYEICMLQWRGCVAIARELLKLNDRLEPARIKP